MALTPACTADTAWAIPERTAVPNAAIDWVAVLTISSPSARNWAFIIVVPAATAAVAWAMPLRIALPKPVIDCCAA
jgi:hypothetical protein